MTLYFEEQGEGRTVVLAHGLFGSSANWRGIARRLGERFRVINVDLPNHGRSPHTTTMSYRDMSEALAELGREIGNGHLDWVGHSMGGKAVMDLALTQPALVRKLVVVDIAPVRYRHSHLAYIDAMLALDPGAIRNRAQAERELEATVEDPATRLFLLQNLVLERGKYRWRLNLPVLRRDLDQIMDFPEQGPATFSGPTLVLYGERSGYVDAGGREAVLRYFPEARFEAVADAGHWVHADQPQSMSEALLRFLG